jgi:hypothetical protein
VKRRRISKVSDPGVDELHFGHVKFEISIRPHSSGNVKEEIGSKTDT